MEYIEEEFEAEQDYCDQCGRDDLPLNLFEIDGVVYWLCPECFEMQAGE